MNLLNSTITDDQHFPLKKYVFKLIALIIDGAKKTDLHSSIPFPLKKKKRKKKRGKSKTFLNTLMKNNYAHVPSL